MRKFFHLYQMIQINWWFLHLQFNEQRIESRAYKDEMTEKMKRENSNMQSVKQNFIVAIAFVSLIAGWAMMLSGVGKSSASFARMDDPVTLVRDVDGPTKEPFQTEVKMNIVSGLSLGSGFIDVPLGKLMVIEHVSVQGTAPAGQNIFPSIYTHVAPDLTLRKHIFPAKNQVFGANTFFLVSESLRLYSDGPSITVRIDRDTTTSTCSATFVVSGYFVDKQF
jgi:hypothetical protein